MYRTSVCVNQCPIEISSTFITDSNSYMHGHSNNITLDVTICSFPLFYEKHFDTFI